jgi:hypothetical protein
MEKKNKKECNSEKWPQMPNDSIKCSITQEYQQKSNLKPNVEDFGDSKIHSCCGICYEPSTRNFTPVFMGCCTNGTCGSCLYQLLKRCKYDHSSGFKCPYCRNPAVLSNFYYHSEEQKVRFHKWQQCCGPQDIKNLKKKLDKSHETQLQVHSESNGSSNSPIIVDIPAQAERIFTSPPSLLSETISYSAGNSILIQPISFPGTIRIYKSNLPGITPTIIVSAGTIVHLTPSHHN